jgi:hypothetical protein
MNQSTFPSDEHIRTCPGYTHWFEGEGFRHVTFHTCRTLTDEELKTVQEGGVTYPFEVNLCTQEKKDE